MKSETKIKDWMMIVLIVVLIVVVAYAVCLISAIANFAGITNYCDFGPFWCCQQQVFGGGGDNETDEGLDTPPELDCDELYTRMVSRIPTLMRDFEDTCIAAGGNFYKQDKYTGCYTPFFFVNCNDAKNVTEYKILKAVCEASGGDWRCQSNMVLCYCPGSKDFPEFECGWVDDDNTYYCDGSCDEGTKCERVGDECQCKEETFGDDL